MDKNKEFSTFLSQSRINKFHSLFHSVPEYENPIDYFHCAFVSDILLQGNLYVSLNWICFYSNIRARLRKIEIKMESIVDITREKTALIIPNAIGVLTADKKYVFGSLMSRDHTYKFTRYIWKRYLEVNQSKQIGKDGKLTVTLGSEVDGLPDSVESSPTEPHDLHAYHSNKDDDDNDEEDEISDEKDDGIESDSTLSNNSSNDLPIIGKSDSSKWSKFNIPSSLPRKKPKPQEMPSKKTRLPLPKIFHKFYRITRLNVVLTLCYILVFALLVLAGVLMYRVVTLQDELHTRKPYSQQLNNEIRFQTHENIYTMRSNVHLAVLEQIRVTLEANIHLLTQMSSTLKQWSFDSRSRSSSEGHCTEHCPVYDV